MLGFTLSTSSDLDKQNKKKPNQTTQKTETENKQFAKKTKASARPAVPLNYVSTVTSPGP